MRPEKLKGGQDPFLPVGSIRGRYNIIVDEWGPYDWRYPQLWPARVADSAWTGAPLALRVLGPPGRWRVVEPAEAAREFPGARVGPIAARRGV